MKLLLKNWANLKIYLFQTFPFFGVVAKLLTEEGKEIKGPGEGYLVINPFIIYTIFGDINNMYYFIKQ